MTIFNLFPSWTSEPFKYLGWLLPKGLKWKNARASPGCAYVPTTVEHIANIITHGIWIPPSLYACSVLLRRSTTRLHYFSAIVYGSALVLCFTVSTVFHSIFYCGHNHAEVVPPSSPVMVDVPVLDQVTVESTVQGDLKYIEAGCKVSNPSSLKAFLHDSGVQFRHNSDSFLYSQCI